MDKSPTTKSDPKKYYMSRVDWERVGGSRGREVELRDVGGWSKVISVKSYCTPSGRASSPFPRPTEKRTELRGRSKVYALRTI